VRAGAPVTVLADSPVAPPVVELGRLAGWDPLPLSIRDARRAAVPLRDRLEGHRPSAAARIPGDVVARVRDLWAGYGRTTVLRGIDLELRAGEIVAVMGRNGAGKSTLLAQLVGLRPRSSGSVEVLGLRPHDLDARQVVRRAGLVPQDAAVLLYNETVDAECSAADRDADLAAGTTRATLERVVPGIDGTSHPRDLSEGQRLGLALAVVLAAEPPVVLLDEPTRGLDYAAKRRLVALLDSLADEGHAVVLATHDVEVVASVADRVVVLAEGEVVADGPARDVVTHSPIFAPQVAKILDPAPWLTVSEVADVLHGVAP
jgi:energy-coupling factor transport system ATP-binding protein